uniref:Fe2OG dioxygenase domain-containing protein n=1 Tax=Chromera velia CCMP2878 TaxID=1169474 RepID=A0A0G4IES5_9ALVE|eukprot:Cvel_2422.t1-p1 / transcript=Cvel_2422.t1 / gene=Cvel_2422 / organism=Chromera_velia_CCMP2878 / gene_product=Transmembrane prolyl 4-hydroxylase, putative / transcript_product=Transmembrane prolyl 4-hydroxylase, putative / location=Cvel_scaffold94:123235-135030(+) / protein_length=640 / sequence_SO=supercontig / SO=protein_coding / is_pseudo=false
MVRECLNPCLFRWCLCLLFCVVFVSSGGDETAFVREVSRRLLFMNPLEPDVDLVWTAGPLISSTLSEVGGGGKGFEEVMLAEARLHIAGQRFDRACGIYSSILSLQPSNQTVVALAAHGLFSSGCSPGDAETALESAAKKGKKINLAVQCALFEVVLHSHSRNKNLARLKKLLKKVIGTRPHEDNEIHPLLRLNFLSEVVSSLDALQESEGDLELLLCIVEVSMKMYKAKKDVADWFHSEELQRVGGLPEDPPSNEAEALKGSLLISQSDPRLLWSRGDTSSLEGSLEMLKAVSEHAGPTRGALEKRFSPYKRMAADLLRDLKDVRRGVDPTIAASFGPLRHLVGQGTFRRQAGTPGSAMSLPLGNPLFLPSLIGETDGAETERAVPQVELWTASDVPPVFRVAGVASPEECDELIQAGRGLMKKSQTGSADGQSSSARKSETAFLTDTWASQAQRKVLQRAAGILGIPFLKPTDFDFQLLHYQKGEHYRLHNDTDNHFEAPRLVTMLLYLGDPVGGGETVFPRALGSSFECESKDECERRSAEWADSCSTSAPGLVSQPRKGDLVFWYNFDQEGFHDPLTIHAGCDVAAGDKWAANLWLDSVDGFSLGFDPLAVPLPFKEEPGGPGRQSSHSHGHSDEL